MSGHRQKYAEHGDLISDPIEVRRERMVGRQPIRGADTAELFGRKEKEKKGPSVGGMATRRSFLRGPGEE